MFKKKLFYFFCMQQIKIKHETYFNLDKKKIIFKYLKKSFSNIFKMSYQNQ